MIIKVKYVSNNWDSALLPGQIEELIEQFKKLTKDAAELEIDSKVTNFQNVPFSTFGTVIDPVVKDIAPHDITAVDLKWYRDNITPLGKGSDLTLLLMHPKDWRANIQGLMSWADTGKPIRVQIVEDGDFASFKADTGIWFITKLALHEICHALFFITGQIDKTHYFDYTQPQGLQGAYNQIDYALLAKNLAERRSKYSKK